MRAPFATLSHLLPICILLTALSHAQQQTWTLTRDCTGNPDIPSGHTFTATVTVDHAQAHLYDTITGTYSSNAASACDFSPYPDGTGRSFYGGGWVGAAFQSGAFVYQVFTDWSSTGNAGGSSGTNDSSGTAGEWPVGTTSGTFQFVPVDSQPGYLNPTPPFVMQLWLTEDSNYVPGEPILTINILADNSPDLELPSRSGCEGICGFPINLTNGNTYIQKQDYSLPGLGGGIHVTRSWNSLWATNIPWESSGLFGDSWQSNYEEHIQVLQAGAKYWRGDGSAWTFAYNSSTQTYSLTSPPDERATLSFNSSTVQFTLALADGTKRIFSQPGYLLSIIDRNGNQTTLSYDASNRLTRVTDASSRVLTFTYGNSSLPGLVTSIQDAVGTVATYAYDATGHLIGVTYTDGSSINFTYDANGLITSTTDSQGKVLETHSYDSARRGLSSQAANGVDSVGINYNGAVATLTDSAGNASQYTAGTRIANRNFVTSVAGSGCDTCGGAS